ncbi:hypothetical protein GUJ93_ZPchr0002g25778 [Zizania palustris]|uniref:Uncharacterized protein n=1 Tax=Zizania palustris TaxID=103762 RepID=A0A8J5SQY4_ZIZPA|nr:hypothetical protein GUJ93_ZPchr0002g25778 [Zizania palustris]
MALALDRGGQLSDLLCGLPPLPFPPPPRKQQQQQGSHGACRLLAAVGFERGRTIEAVGRRGAGGHGRYGWRRDPWLLPNGRWLPVAKGLTELLVLTFARGTG